MKNVHPRPGDTLLHPVPLIAIAVLLVNDHVLKAAFPGFITGKLSDVAGLVFFPLFLLAVFELLVDRNTDDFCPRAAPLVLAVIVTAVVFMLVQIWPPATDVYRHGLGALQWPFRALVAIIGGAAAGPVVPVVVFADPTDLFTVPSVLVSLAVGWSRLRPEQADADVDTLHR